MKPNIHSTITIAGHTLPLRFTIGLFAEAQERTGIPFFPLGVSEFWQNVFKGLVIVLAVIFDQMNQKMNSRVSASAKAPPAKTESTKQPQAAAGRFAAARHQA